MNSLKFDFQLGLENYANELKSHKPNVSLQKAVNEAGMAYLRVSRIYNRCFVCELFQK